MLGLYKIVGKVVESIKLLVFDAVLNNWNCCASTKLDVLIHRLFYKLEAYKVLKEGLRFAIPIHAYLNNYRAKKDQISYYSAQNGGQLFG